MNLFTNEIDGWDSWGRLYQSIPTFEPLIQSIFAKEKLPFTEIEHCTPGTNAVFKIGKYVIKIFAPAESGIDSTMDFTTELFAMRRAVQLGVSVPKLVASGEVKDKFLFSYLIMEYIDGTELNKINYTLTLADKIAIGHKLRKLTDRMNIPCVPFNDTDVIQDENRQKRWAKYPERFKKERKNYIKNYKFAEKVFVHGDLNGDNLLLADDHTIHIIDFADAVRAPLVYEQALIACELFKFDKAYMQGYFGCAPIEEITEICFNGLLIHDFGGDVIEQNICPSTELKNLDILREKIDLLLTNNE
ncbi:serine/threonine protein kinase [Lederbergia galactosidilyticus]|uniref:phosphotransferase n=1 Tax=Lederbergia galactosidilytica TaxID=217031 RepID=UPI001AE87F8A|nr:phosphotransferase [Lederbergia galactosidilytica]MBP1913884.1 serine/threonine protein kinase [Lederbergia galactosidilytica]